MNQQSFNDLVSSLKKGGFTDNKVGTALASISAAGSITSAQVAQLVKLISFSDAQLEVAKGAYPYAKDKASYASVVGAALSFSDTKEKLNEFIRYY